MFRLIPREETFFDYFEQAARNVHEGAVALASLFDNFDDAENRAARIKEIEHVGDKITHDTITRLNKTFITPIDRDDIHKLISRLDDVIDFIDAGVSRMILYKIEKPTEEAKALSRVLVEATAILVDLLPRLRHGTGTEEVHQLCIEINTKENDGDRILQHALAALFNSNFDTATIIKWKDVYENLEAATDRCEDVANIVESIALKNA
jgi:predicted phosphate transport protein (TIGR00153 family)